jgi:hypothetical protein
VARVLLVFPTSWDRRQIEGSRFDVAIHGPTDEERPDEFDVLGFLDETAAAFSARVDGVLSASDYPGATCAAALSRRLGRPGSDPAAILRASHKYYSRLAQREAAPEAVPRFALVDPRDPRPPFLPCFVKPVKGGFSIMARRVDSAEELRAFLGSPAARWFLDSYMKTFNTLVGAFARFEVDGRAFIAEEVLRGRAVTVEGWAASRPRILGIVDSVFHGNGSFARFDYPSSLPESVQDRMSEVARRVVDRLGLQSTFFNIEMMWDEGTDRISILEVNPRLAGQFGDLYEKVDGVNSYELAMELACGGEPSVPRRGRFRRASSRPLRIFEKSRVVRAPSAEEAARVEQDFPGTRIWLECATGTEFTDFERLEDGRSARYAIVNAGADSAEEMERKLAEIERRLDFRFERFATYDG